MEFHGSELSLVKLDLKDALELHSVMLANYEHFERYLPVTLKQNLTSQKSAAYIKKKTEEWKTGTGYTLAIKWLATHSLVGLIILKNIKREQQQAEFAYCIAKGHEGKGLATKAVQVLIQLAITTLGLTTFQIIAHKENLGSVKVAQKNGFKWAQTLLNAHKTVDGLQLDMELYVLNKRAVLKA